MSHNAPGDAVSHWQKSIENFFTSPTAFYADVESALERRKIHGLKTQRVKWSEGGVLTPDREYLQVSGDRHLFDMCAAPFGTGFFFSSWVTRRQARFVPLYAMLLAFVVFVAWGAIPWFFGELFRGGQQTLVGLGLLAFVTNPFVVGPLALVAALGFVALTARIVAPDFELAVLALPGVGWLHERLFAQQTYYRLDTMLMFQSAVHAAMLEAIDALTTQKGLRALTEEERKPLFHKLM